MALLYYKNCCHKVIRKWQTLRMCSSVQFNEGKPSKQPYKPKKKKKEFGVFVTGEILFGVHSVSMALEAGKRKVYTIYYNDGSPRTFETVALARSKGITVKQESRNLLSQLTANNSKVAGAHKGICADVSPLIQRAVNVPPDEESEDLLLFKRGQLWLLLCSIGDPFNLGAIIRSAYFLGADRIFTCSPKDCFQASAPLSPVASRSSAGVVEYFTPDLVRDPNSFLSHYKQKGWSIVGTGSRSDSQPVDKYELQEEQNTILLIGNEGEGITESLSGECCSFVHLPPGRQLHKELDSLNVSVATALLIHSFKNQKMN